MKTRTLIIDALVYERNKAFGFQEYLFNLLNYFYEHRDCIHFQKIIIVCDENQIQEFTKFKDRFDIVGYKVPNLISRFLVQSLIPFMLKLKKIDVVLNLCNYSSLFKRSKNLLVIHDLLYLRKDLLSNKLMRLQRKFYVPRSIALAENIIAISDFTKDDIQYNFKIPSKTTILKIYNHFNFDKFVIYPNTTNEIYKDKYFLSVSSSAFHKNSITVLKAFEKFCLYNNDKKLYIVGQISEINTQKYYEELDPLIKNRIKVFSNISNYELGLLYYGCDAYISATLFEGLGMPIIEAMFFNSQLILSDIEICREITENQAFFFDPNSYEDLFEIMLNIKKEKKDTKTFVLNKFSSNNTSKKYIEVLNAM